MPAEVGTAALPFVFLAGNDGAYIVAAAVADPYVEVTATLPGTSLAATATANVVAAQTTTLDLVLVGSATTATVSPADGADAVPVSTQVEITSPVALDPATVDGGQRPASRGRRTR